MSVAVTSRYREWVLPGAAEVIACRWEQITGPGAGGHVQRVLPDGCADVIVTGTGSAFLVGPTAQVALPELAPGSRLVGLRFRAEAIGAALGVPGYELRDRDLPLDEVLGAMRARQLVDALIGPEEFGGAWIRRWVAGIGVNHRTAVAVHQLRTAATGDVATIAAAVGLSGRQLRRVMLADVGLGPKTLQRIGRLQRFLALAERAGGAARPVVGRPVEEWGRPAERGRPAQRGSLALWAAEVGYADQAHLTRDVAALAATTPARLVAERRGS
jgi:AraC-like DNA-binding protein